MAKATSASGIGGRMASARDKRGISQTGLAKAVGVSRGAVGQWESGETCPSTENLATAAVELNVAFEWLATQRGPMEIPKIVPDTPTKGIKSVPLVSWVSAGRLVDSSSQIPVEDVPLLAFAGLGRGEFFALKVQGDSMDRLSPDGSIIVVDRSDRSLVSGRCFVFAIRGEATYKRWHADPPYLAPYSTNPSHQPIFLRRQRDLEVIGRVRRTVLDL